MNFTRNLRRAIAMTAVIAAPAVIIPMASATPSDAEGEHKVTICHVTNSDTNLFVVVDVDVAAFDGEGANDHTSHVSKDGRFDSLYVDGLCPGAMAPTTTTTTTISSTPPNS